MPRISIDAGAFQALLNIYNRMCEETDRHDGSAAIEMRDAALKTVEQIPDTPLNAPVPAFEDTGWDFFIEDVNHKLAKYKWSRQDFLPGVGMGLSRQPDGGLRARILSNIPSAVFNRALTAFCGRTGVCLQHSYSSYPYVFEMPNLHAWLAMRGSTPEFVPEAMLVWQTSRKESLTQVDLIALEDKRSGFYCGEKRADPRSLGKPAGHWDRTGQ